MSEHRQKGQTAGSDGWCAWCEQRWPCRTDLKAQVERLKREVLATEVPAGCSHRTKRRYRCYDCSRTFCKRCIKTHCMAERDEAHRQLAAVVEALVRTGRWARLPDGYLMCRVCCTGMRCECEPGEHVPREGCSNCLGRSGSILADIPAAGAKLERAEKLAEALPDPDKLRLLADWFDGDDEAKGRRGSSLATLGGQSPNEVQRELRGWATDIDAALREEGK